MNDDELIARLRRLDSTGPDRILDPATVLTRGRRAHRRRLAGGAGAASLSVAAIVGLILALPHGGAGEIVVTPASPPTAQPTPLPSPGFSPATPGDTMSDAQMQQAERTNNAILQRELGPDFDISDGKGGARPGTAAAAALPAGFTSEGFIDAGPDDRSTEEACGAYAATGEPCLASTLPDGKVVLVQRGGKDEPGQAAPDFEAIHVFYRQPNATLVQVELRAIPGDRFDAAADAAARKWLESYVDRLAAAATDPAIQAEYPDRQQVAVAPACPGGLQPAQEAGPTCAVIRPAARPSSRPASA